MTDPEKYTDILHVLSGVTRDQGKSTLKFVKSIPLGINTRECSLPLRGFANEVFFYRRYQQEQQILFSVNVVDIDSNHVD